MCTHTRVGTTPARTPLHMQMCKATSAHTCACVHIWTCTHMYVVTHTCVHTHACTWSSVSVHTHTDRHDTHLHTAEHANVQGHLCAHTSTRAHMDVHTLVCSRTCMQTHPDSHTCMCTHAWAPHCRPSTQSWGAAPMGAHHPGAGPPPRLTTACQTLGQVTFTSAQLSPPSS